MQFGTFPKNHPFWCPHLSLSSPTKWISVLILDIYVVKIIIKIQYSYVLGGSALDSDETEFIKTEIERLSNMTKVSVVS